MYKFQDRQGYLEKSCLEKQNKETNTSKTAKIILIISTLLLLLFFFRSIAQDNLKLKEILLPQAPGTWDYRCAPPHLVLHPMHRSYKGWPDMYKLGQLCLGCWDSAESGLLQQLKEGCG